MSPDQIQMPDVQEVREDLAAAKADLQAAIKENPELASQSKFLMEVLEVLEEKVSSSNDLNTLNKKDQISVVAHLNLFYTLLDDVFGEEFEELDDFDEELEDFDDVTEDEK